jgi:acetylglutamate synthase
VYKRQALRRIVESQEAQQSKNLADVLSRRMAPDGSNQTMLQKFHMGGRLTKTPVSNVTMVPRRGVRWPLADVLNAMISQEDLPQGFDDLDAETKAEVASNLKRFNVHESNLTNENSANMTNQASSLLEMAKMLEADAQSKREQAYRMDPNLRPSVKRASSATTILTEEAVGEPSVLSAIEAPVKATKKRKAA